MSDKDSIGLKLMGVGVSLIVGGGVALLGNEFLFKFRPVMFVGLFLVCFGIVIITFGLYKALSGPKEIDKNEVTIMYWQYIRNHLETDFKKQVGLAVLGIFPEILQTTKRARTYFEKSPRKKKDIRLLDIVEDDIHRIILDAKEDPEIIEKDLPKRAHDIREKISNRIKELG